MSIRLKRQAKRRRRHATILVAALMAAACASSNPGAPGAVDKALDLFGLQVKPAAAPPPSTERLAEIAARQPTRLTLRIHAGEALNSDAAGHPLSLVIRWYRLKSADAFLQAPYATFKDAAEGTVPMQGVIDEREIVLTPGQKYEVVEKLPVGTAYVALVALFRSPDPERWRFVFDVDPIARSGLTVGAHGCALSVSEGVPINARPESLRLAGARCR